MDQDQRSPGRPPAARPDPAPRIRTWDSKKRDWVWVRPRRTAPSPLSAVHGGSSDTDSRPPTPPPKSPRHQPLAAEGRTAWPDTLPPGAAAPALSVWSTLGARRQAVDAGAGAVAKPRARSLFARREGEAEPEPARPRSWLGALGTMLTRKRTRSAPLPSGTTRAGTGDFVPRWEYAALDAYASLGAPPGRGGGGGAGG